MCYPTACAADYTLAIMILKPCHNTQHMQHCVQVVCSLDLKHYLRVLVSVCMNLCVCMCRFTCCACVCIGSQRTAFGAVSREQPLRLLKLESVIGLKLDC